MQIRSLYFDDYENSCFAETMDGVNDRKSSVSVSMADVLTKFPGEQNIAEWDDQERQLYAD